jgi:hypothetical protein
MGTAIFRANKLKAGGARAMAQHALREREVANAVAGAPLPMPMVGEGSSKAVMARLAQLEAAAKATGQRLRDNNTRAIDMLMTYSQTKDIPDFQDQEAFFKRCISWINKQFPYAQILTAVVHRDESTPHLQLLLAPLDERGHFNAKKLLGGPADLSKLQDSYWETVGKPAGLQRGEKGSKARHVPVKQLYQAMDAGYEPPKLVEVPPAPGMLDRLKPGYKVKIEARQAAIAKNQAVRQEVGKQAARGRAVHPEMLRRQSQRLRELNRQVEQAKLADKVVADARAEHDKLKVQTQQLKAQSLAAQQMVASIEQRTNDREFIQAVDSLLAKADGRYLARLGAELGIPIQPGAGVLDRVRRQLAIVGQGSTLATIHRLDDAAAAAGSQAVSEAAWRLLERLEPTPEPSDARTRETGFEADYDAPQP